MVQIETIVEQADKGPDGARGAVILGLAQQQGAAPLEIPQVDIVAKGGADNFSGRRDGQHDFRLRVAPGRIGVNADLGADADRRHGLGFGKDLRIRADAHFQILRPQAPFGQNPLDPCRFIGTRHHVGQGSADLGPDGVPDFRRLFRITFGLFLDHPFQHGADECNAARLQRLQVGRCQKIGLPVVAILVGAVGDHGTHLAQSFPLARLGGIAWVLHGQQTGQCGRHGGQIEHAIIGDQHGRRAAIGAWQPDPADKTAGPQAVFG